MTSKLDALLDFDAVKDPPLLFADCGELLSHYSPDTIEDVPKRLMRPFENLRTGKPEYLIGKYNHLAICNLIRRAADELEEPKRIRAHLEKQLAEQKLRREIRDERVLNRREEEARHERMRLRAEELRSRQSGWQHNRR